jgi:hypothetical protein
MYLYRCENRGCKWLKDTANVSRKQYETTQTSKAKNPNCKHCNLVMKGPTTPAAARPAVFDFNAAVTKVRTKLQTVNAAATKQYCEAVMTYLQANATALKDTFVEDIKKDAYVDVFVNANRANDVQKRCVDDALKRASAPMAVGHPTGEKFDWEIPYIMSVAGWDRLAAGAGKYWMSMVDFLGQCQPGQQYLLASRPRGSADGHTILITNSGGTLWVSDVQEQGYNYGQCDCIAWKRPAAADGKAFAVPLPKRQVTTAGAFSGSWVR